MEFTSSDRSEDQRSTDELQSVRIDPETLKRIDYALEGTIEVDVSALSPDDKLTLLIERYNRREQKMEENSDSRP
jgi:hypothetical protein